MAEKILSQDEVEALLQGVTDGAVESEQETVDDKEGIHAYDLTNQERVIRGRMPSLEIINERLARFSQLSISSFLKREIEMVPITVEIPKFGEFMRKIPLPSSINILKMGNLRGFILLVIDAKIIYRLVDLYFGGKGQTYVKIEGRDFTTIEQRILQKVVDQLLIDMERSWKSIHPVKFTYVRREINPQFAAIISPMEAIVSNSFKAEIEGEGGEIFIGLPYPTIEPIREKLYGGFQSDQHEEDSTWTKNFSKELVQCFMEVKALVGEVELTIGEIRDLSIGDTIMLNQSVNDDLVIKAEGKPIFRGMPGLHKGNVAVQITSIENDRKEDESGG